MIACIMLCGCEIRMEAPEETEETLPVIVTTEITEETEPEPQPYPVKINDVIIEKKPERVVSLSSSLTEILYEMGYGDTVVGRGSYCDFPLEVEAVTDMGRPSKPNFDSIISVKPDILFTATAIPVKDMYKLEENGIKVVYIPCPTTLEEFERVYAALGLIFEGIFDGESIGGNHFSSLKSIINNADIELGKFIYVTEGLTIATGDTFENSVLSNFGTNIAADGKDYSYPKEYLAEFQPEIILLNDNYTVDDLLADELFSTLDAVVNGNVYCISNTYFERPSYRLSELVEALSAISE